MNSVINKDRAREKKKEDVVVSFDVYMSVSEPPYDRKDGAEKGAKLGATPSAEAALLVGFTQMPLDMLDQVERYVGDHGIRIRRWQQTWDSLSKDRKETGWIPRD